MAFDMKDLGEVKYYLGIHIGRDLQNKTISLNQAQFTDKLLKKLNMENSKGKSTPMETKLKLNMENVTDMEQNQFVNS